MAVDLNYRLKELFQSLKESGVINDLVSTTSSFYDEPGMFSYNGEFGNMDKIADDATDFFVNKPVQASGTSFFSKSKAILSCLAEGVERLSLYHYKKNEIDFFASDRIQSFSADKISSSAKIGWVKGFNLTQGKEDYIPAQLVSLIFYIKHKEPKLSTNISSGAAFGFDLLTSLLNGIYEVIERDSFMTIYLGKIPVPKINLDAVYDKKIKLLKDKFERYNLKWLVFDFTTDLGIPVAVSLIVDRTGYGPSSSFGAKCSFNQKENIIASAEEALMIRNATRNTINDVFIHKRTDGINRRHHYFNKMFYWWPINKLEDLDFLLQSEEEDLKTSSTFSNKKRELNHVVTLLKKKNHDVYYKDITIDYFKKKGFIVTRTIIPSLQPLYLYERFRKIFVFRLKEVQKFFKTDFLINEIPHPFL